MTSTFLPGSFDFFSLLLLLSLLLVLLLLLVIEGSRYVSRHRSPHTDINTDRFIDAVTEFANNDIHTDRFRDALTEFANNDIDTDNFLDALAEFAHNCTKMNNPQDYKLKLQHIIGKIGSKNKPNLAIKKSKKEMEPLDDNNPKVESLPDNNNDNDNDIPATGTSTTPLLVQIIREIKGNLSSSDNYGKMLLATIGTGSVPVFLQLIRDIKSSLSNYSLTSKDIKPQTLAPQLPLAKETTYPADQNMTTTYINETKPKMKLTYQVLNEGEGETMTKYRQGCFQYKEAGSVEDISFQGSPTELAIKLCPGFEEAMLEAIVGMKSNGRRIIFIPHEVSGLENNTFLELKLTTIRDLNLRSRI